MTLEAVGVTQEALTSCVAIGASGDAMLSNPPMNGNFGTQPILRAGGKDESLVRFDLSAIPSFAVIDSATLKFYVSGSGSDAPVNVHRATSEWAESTVTYASFGQHFDAAVLGSLLAASPNVQKSIDVTPLVTSWITGAQANFGVLLEANSTSKKAIIASREGGTAEQKPALQLCYTVPDDHCSPNPCEKGATCENNATGYVCHCAAGYTGTTCGININECASSPCQNGGTCADGVNSYSCACAAGYAGGTCEINIDDCAPSPCRNNGVCEDGIASYTCHCPPGYSGANCEALIDNCGPQPCQNGATCTNGTDNYACTCATGFTGTHCEINIDDCASQPCHNGGTCIDGVNSYTCACPPDWGGAACDVNLNKCSQNPCLNGSICTNGSGNYTCTCAAGYAGTNCEIDINDCAVNPCLNGGVCVDGVNSYTCQCAGAFRGTNCDIPTPSVTFRLTPEATTQQTTATFAFSADDPAATFQCALDGGGLAPCTSPQTLSGLRKDRTHTFTLVASDLLGHTNTTSFSWIVVYPASCGDIKFAQAAAADGYYVIDVDGIGPTSPQLVYCDMTTNGGGTQVGSGGGADYCATATCNNDGTCIDGLTSYQCDCPPDWGGQDCSVYLNSCSQVSCHNGGTCVNGYGTYTCNCGVGFTGDLCQTNIDDCASQPCQHSGTCTDRVNGYACACPTGYHGTNCEVADDAGPSVTFTQGPYQGASIEDTTATFAWTTDAPATFTCQLDAATPGACISPKNYSALTRDVVHTFTLRATDGLGVTTTSSYSWTVVYPTSCLDMYVHNPTSTSGMYTIDPDGMGPTAPSAVQCRF